MISWIVVWMCFWGVGMGLPNYFYKRYKFTYFENPILNTVWYISVSALLFLVYGKQYETYFEPFSLAHFIFVCITLGLWLGVQRFFKNDGFTIQERLYYSVPKFFEILFQQLGFLAGLLTFGVAPYVFALLFFLIHIPLVFFIPFKLALLAIVGSFFGGFVFASLHVLGMHGFIFALIIHIFAYIGLSLFLLQRPNSKIGSLKR